MNGIGFVVATLGGTLTVPRAKGPARRCIDGHEKAQAPKKPRIKQPPKKCGAKPKHTPAEIRAMVALIEAGRGPTEVGRMFGIARETVHRHLRRHKAAKETT